MRGEISDLQVLMRDQRERYLTEIVVQHDGAPEYWASLLSLDRKTKFWNLVLLNVALRIGETAVMYYKDHYARPRPSTLAPGLCVPFGPPAHPAFPSGHATQSRLMTLCLNEMLPVTMQPTYRIALDWLADRVAVNRERGGFHYHTDSRAGKYLAEKCFELIQPLFTTAGTNFKYLADKAKGEWL